MSSTPKPVAQENAELAAEAVLCTMKKSLPELITPVILENDRSSPNTSIILMVESFLLPPVFVYSAAHLCTLSTTP